VFVPRADALPAAQAVVVHPDGHVPQIEHTVLVPLPLTGEPGAHTVEVKLPEPHTAQLVSVVSAVELQAPEAYDDPDTGAVHGATGAPAPAAQV